MSVYDTASCCSPTRVSTLQRVRLCAVALPGLLFVFLLLCAVAPRRTEVRLVRPFERLTSEPSNESRLLYYANRVDVQCPGPDGVYFITRSSGACVGLNHYVANLRILLREAKATGRVAVLKPICLCARHNGMMRVRASWDRYLDVRSFGVDVVMPPDPVDDWIAHVKRSRPGDVEVLEGSTVPFERLANSQSKVVIRQMPDEREFVAASWGVREVEAKKDVPWNPRVAESVHIHNAASRALEELSMYGPSFVCVRARRGDKLRGIPHRLMYPCLNKCTEPPNIAGVLRRHGIDGTTNETVYLMTDEKKSAFFASLTHEHGLNVRTMSDLKSVRDFAKYDNFFAFAIEQAMCRHARGVIGSFQNSVSVLGAYQQDFKRPPMDFTDSLTPYIGECLSSRQSKVNIKACDDAYDHYPRCTKVCNP